MQQDQRNMFLAIVLSLSVVMGWQFFFGPEPVDPAEQAAIEQQLQDGTLPYPDETDTSPSVGGDNTIAIDRDAALRLSPRVVIDAPSLDGSISLTGARIDDLHLRDYRETLDPESPEITLLSPSSSDQSYYAEFGWLSTSGIDGLVPSNSSVWSLTEPGAVLSADNPITLVWSNGSGLSFSRTISIDDDFMFTVTQTVTNSTNQPVTLHPYGLVARRNEPEGRRIWISYEGPFGYLDGQRRNVSYKDLREDGEQFTSTGGWIGITDKFWMTTLAPQEGIDFEGQFTHRPMVGGTELFQAAYRMSPQTIAPGGSVEVSSNLFAGAKVVSLINQYREQLGIMRFDLTMDWGWLFFLTKPFFWALLYLKGIVGNFGVAILLFTVLVKLVFFPLANKSYESMAKMRKVQPKIEEIRERAGDDKQKQQQEMMELYKREKLNPLAGCLPMLIQIPVFFALYQVLYVTIEMRHAPFFGWIQDLSAPDPTSVFNLFGLMPWSVESMAAVPLIGGLLTLGAWPMVMGFTMWFQMQLNPPPPDPMQRRMFALMPLFFMFLLAGFSAGLVIYWAWNAFLGILQQTAIMKRQGVSVNPFNQMKFLHPLIAMFSSSSSGVPKAEHKAREEDAETTPAAIEAVEPVAVEEAEEADEVEPVEDVTGEVVEEEPIDPADDEEWHPDDVVLDDVEDETPKKDAD